MHSEKKEPSVTSKVTCPVCNTFFGFTRSDGSMPEFDSCPKTPAERCNHPTVAARIADGEHREANALVKKLGLEPPPCPIEQMFAPKAKTVDQPAGGSVPPTNNDDYFEVD